MLTFPITLLLFMEIEAQSITANTTPLVPILFDTAKTAGSITTTAASTGPGPVCRDLRSICSRYRYLNRCRESSYVSFTQKYCRKTCGFCGSGACIDTTTRCIDYIKRFGKDVTCTNSNYKNICCATCQDVIGSPACADQKSSCSAYRYNDRCRSGSSAIYAQKYCKKTCGFCGAVRIDTSTECSRYVRKYTSSVACMFFGKSCMATCARYPTCKDKYSWCKTSSTSYVCKYRKDYCCETCQKYQVDNYCYDKKPHCHKYSQSTACGALKNYCCASCRALGGDCKTCVDKYQWCKSSSQSYVCKFRRSYCCATCRNYQVDDSCHDKKPHCHKYNQSIACGTYKNYCCESCRKLSGGVSGCVDKQSSCQKWSPSFVCKVHKDKCCKTCRNYKVDQYCYDKNPQCHMQNQSLVCGALKNMCCGSCCKLSAQCSDRSSMCRTSSKSYICKYGKNICCATCLNYKVNPTCYDTMPQCHKYSKSIACGVLRPRCCASCKKLEGGGVPFKAT